MYNPLYSPGVKRNAEENNILCKDENRAMFKRVTLKYS